MLEKKSNRQYLEKVNVLLEDVDNTIFNITNIPQILYSGNNHFLIYGSDKLKQNSEIAIEILDSNNNTIYYEISKDYNFGGNRLVSIKIFDYVENGLATLTILGILNTNDVEWKNKYNVKTTRKIIVDKTLNNNSDIIFKNFPTASINEVFRTDLNTENSTIYSNYNSGSISTYIATNVKNTNLNYSTMKLVSGSLNEKMLNSKIEIYSGSITHSAIIDRIVNETYCYIKPNYLENDIVKTFDNCNYNIQYINSTYQETFLSSSYAEIVLNNLETLSGKIDKIKVFSKNINRNEDYKLLGDYPLLSWNNYYAWSGSLLIDTGVLKKYWSSYYDNGGLISTNYIITENDNVLLNSIQINTEPHESTAYAYIVNNTPFTVIKGNKYVLEFDRAVLLKDLYNTDCNFKISAYGTSLYNSDETLLYEEYNIDNTVISPTYLGKKFIVFEPNKTGTLFIKFIFGAGTWYLSNLKLYDYFDVGINPNNTKLYIPINNFKRNEQYVFKIEYKNINNLSSQNYSEINLPLNFIGNPKYIQLDDNVLDGKLKIGNNINSNGIEISGKETNGSYISSVGYKGYYSASNNIGDSGFLIYSGSVLNTLTNEYENGVGLELHGGYKSGSMRFKADGLNSFLEITGSIFAENGYFSGLLSASTGHIASFYINETSITSNNNTNTSRFILSQSANIRDIGLHLNDGNNVNRLQIGLVNTTGSKISDYGNIALTSSATNSDNMATLSKWSILDDTTPGIARLDMSSYTLTSASISINSILINELDFIPAGGYLYTNNTNNNFNSVPSGQYILSVKSYQSSGKDRAIFKIIIKDDSDNVLFNSNNYVTNSDEYNLHQFAFTISETKNLRIYYYCSLLSYNSQFYLFDTKIQPYVSRMSITERGLLLSTSPNKYILLSDFFNLIGINEIQTDIIYANKIISDDLVKISINTDNTILNYFNITGSFVDNNNNDISNISAKCFDFWISKKPYGQISTIGTSNIELKNLYNCGLITNYTTSSVEDYIYKFSNVSQSGLISSSINNIFSFSIYSSLPVGGYINISYNNKIYTEYLDIA